MKKYISILVIVISALIAFSGCKDSVKENKKETESARDSMSESKDDKLTIDILKIDFGMGNSGEGIKWGDDTSTVHKVAHSEYRAANGNNMTGLFTRYWIDEFQDNEEVLGYVDFSFNRDNGGLEQFKYVFATKEHVEINAISLETVKKLKEHFANGFNNKYQNSASEEEVSAVDSLLSSNFDYDMYWLTDSSIINVSYRETGYLKITFIDRDIEFYQAIVQVIENKMKTAK